MLNIGNTKDYKTHQELVDILKNRRLIIEDEQAVLDYFKCVNYYRFSAYTLTLRKDDVFYPNVTFENVCDLYGFDYGFRKIIYAYSAYVEIALRSTVSLFHAGKYGALGYLDAKNFHNPMYHARFLTALDGELDRSDDAFVHHHIQDLGSVFPLWVAVEASSFGVLSMMFKNMHNNDKNDIVKQRFRFGRKYIENWLQCCVYARNIAAHGGRFYNRDLRSCPVKLPKKHQSTIVPTKAFAFIYAIFHLLPAEEIRKNFIVEIENLFRAHPFAMLKHVGFPSNWSDYLK